MIYLLGTIVLIIGGFAYCYYTAYNKGYSNGVYDKNRLNNINEFLRNSTKFYEKKDTND